MRRINSRLPVEHHTGGFGNTGTHRVVPPQLTASSCSRIRPPGTIPLAVSLPRMLEKIEAELATAGPAEKGASGGELN